MILVFVFVAVCSVLIAGTFANKDIRVIDNKSYISNDTIIETEIDSFQIKTDSLNGIKENLIKEVFDYIKKVAPRSKMNAHNIVNACLEQEFDITLLLSQGHQETHFATCGSNNCFGIVGKRYAHPDESVSDYIDLMQRRYVGTKTTEQVIASNFKLIGSKSTHYSTSSGYGSLIASIRKDIMTNTNIYQLFNDVIELNRQITSFGLID